MAISALRAVQIGAQSGFGTGVAATVRLQALTDASLSIVDEVLQPETLGVVAPTSAPAQVQQHAEGSITQQASYQDLVYMCAGVFGTVASSAAASTTYVWKFAAATRTSVTPQIYTMEYGAPGAEYRAISAIINSLQITGEAGGMWESTVEVLAQAVEATALTTGLTIRDVGMIRMADTKLAIDAWGGTMGATEVAATLISFDMTASPGGHLKQFAGSLTPQAYGMGRWEGTLTTVLEFNNTSKAYVDGLLSGLVQRQIQIKATTGAGAAARESTIQFCGTLIDGAELFSDRDGNITVDLTWKGTYNSTFGGWLKVRVKNENSAL